MQEIIVTTISALCRECGLFTPHYEHERTKIDAHGRCVCGVCVRMERMVERRVHQQLQERLESLLARLEALEAQVRSVTPVGKKKS